MEIYSCIIFRPIRQNERILPENVAISAAHGQSASTTKV